MKPYMSISDEEANTILADYISLKKSPEARKQLRGALGENYKGLRKAIAQKYDTTEYSIDKLINEAKSDGSEVSKQLIELTQRKVYDVAQMYADKQTGMSTKYIAQKHGISTSTVRKRLKNYTPSISLESAVESAAPVEKKSIITSISEYLGAVKAYSQAGNVMKEYLTRIALGGAALLALGAGFYLFSDSNGAEKQKVPQAVEKAKEVLSQKKAPTKVVAEEPKINLVIKDAKLEPVRAETVPRESVTIFPVAQRKIELVETPALESKSSAMDPAEKQAPKREATKKAPEGLETVVADAAKQAKAGVKGTDNETDAYRWTQFSEVSKKYGYNPENMEEFTGAVSKNLESYVSDLKIAKEKIDKWSAKYNKSNKLGRFFTAVGAKVLRLNPAQRQYGRNSAVEGYREASKIYGEMIERAEKGIESAQKKDARAAAVALQDLYNAREHLYNGLSKEKRELMQPLFNLKGIDIVNMQFVRNQAPMSVFGKIVTHKPYVDPFVEALPADEPVGSKGYIHMPWEIIGKISLLGVTARDLWGGTNMQKALNNPWGNGVTPWRDHSTYAKRIGRTFRVGATNYFTTKELLDNDNGNGDNGGDNGDGEGGNGVSGGHEGAPGGGGGAPPAGGPAGGHIGAPGGGATGPTVPEGIGGGRIGAPGGGSSA